MKNKLFAKKYYFCTMKMAKDESLKSKDKKIVNCQFSTLNFQFAPIVQRIERKFPKL